MSSPDRPLNNRAIAGLYPPGSTFKPVTAIAGWDVRGPLSERTFQCPGHYRLGNRVFRDWTPTGHGTVGLSRSLAESCDIVYYTLGEEMDARDQRLYDQARSRDPGAELHQHLQDVARAFGMGRWTRLGRVVLPSCAPYLATGVRISASVAANPVRLRRWRAPS